MPRGKMIVMNSGVLSAMTMMAATTWSVHLTKPSMFILIMTSITSMSLAKRLTILPMGVVS